MERGLEQKKQPCGVLVWRAYEDHTDKETVCVGVEYTDGSSMVFREWEPSLKSMIVESAFALSDKLGVPIEWSKDYDN